MSEKRFTDTNDGIYDNQEKRLYKISAYEFFDCETDEVVDLLNELNDENKELKKDNKRLAKNLKVAKENVDANFRSAQYWRQKFEAIPKSYTCTSGGFGQNE